MNKNRLTLLVSTLVILEGCMKKEPDPVPAMQTPYECTGTHYFQRLYTALSSAFIFPTSGGSLLLYDQSHQFIKTDTSGNILWAKQIGHYGDGNIFRRRAANRFYSQTKTSTTFNLGIYDDDLNLLHSAAFSAIGNFNIFPARDSFVVVSVNAVASKSNLRKLAVTWLDSALRTRWTYQEQSGYNYLLDMDEDAQFVYLGGSQYNFNENTGIINGSKAYAVKLDKTDGHSVWTKTFYLPDVAFTLIDSVAALGNGHLRIGGVAFRGNKNERVYTVLETDENGTVLSRNNVEAPTKPYVGIPIEAYGSNRHLVIENQGTGGDYGEILAVMYDGAGIEIWRKIFGGEGAQSARSAVILPTGGILISGTTSYYNGTDRTPVNKMLLIKCDASGNTCY